MGVTNTTLTVTIVTRVPDDGAEDLLLEADIVAADNNDESTYYVGESYILRLFKSTNITSLTVGNNIGSVSKRSSGLTTLVPYEGEDKEYVTFSGSDSSSLAKVYEGSLTATPVGSFFDKNGAITGAPSPVPTRGSKNLKVNREIYGVYEVSYITKYDTYQFSSPTAGPMLIFFIGVGV